MLTKEIINKEFEKVGTIQYDWSRSFTSKSSFDLACQTLYDINFQLYNTEMDFKEYFKQQAKEMLENE